VKIQVEGDARVFHCPKEKPCKFRKVDFIWSWRWDSNPQPADYKSAALPIELRQHYGDPEGI
jgi:hypothetical protein